MLMWELVSPFAKSKCVMISYTVKKYETSTSTTVRINRVRKEPSTTVVEYDAPGTVQWMPCLSPGPGHFPKNAVTSGLDKKRSDSELYVARAHLQGALLPGKLKIQSGHLSCYVSSNGKEHSVSTYEVLVAPPGILQWTPSSGGHVVSGAIVGGRTETGETMYIGRVQHLGANIPGRIHPSHQVCYITDNNGKELAFGKYEVLYGPGFISYLMKS